MIYNNEIILDGDKNDQEISRQQDVQNRINFTTKLVILFYVNLIIIFLSKNTNIWATITL